MPKYDAFTGTSPAPWREIAEDRATCPILHVNGPGGFDYYQVNTYDLIRDVNRRHEAFSNRMGVVPRGAEADGEQVLEFADPPEHTLHRQLIGKAFSAARVNERAGRIQEIADDLVDQCAAHGESFRLRHDFARQLPSQVIAELLGVPNDEREKFIAWSEAAEAAVGELNKSEELLANEKALLDYCIAQLRSRVHSPRDDLLSTIVHAQVEGARLTESEAASMVRLLLGAGNGTTSIGISNLVYLLEDNPREKAKLLADMNGLLSSAVEEGFRFDCPVQGNLRGVKHDAEVGGVPVHAGERLYSFYTSGNHDPKKYDRPDEFLVDRDWSTLPRHFAFGFGIHFCVGAELARAETQTAIRTLYTRLPGLRMKKGFIPEQVPGMVFRTWREIEMVFDGPVGPRLSAGKPGA
jgi:cytochrome P450